MTEEDVNNLLCLDRAYTYLYMAQEMLVQAHMVYASAYLRDLKTDHGINDAWNTVSNLYKAVGKEYTTMKKEMKE